jgi:cytidylate kinase
VDSGAVYRACTLIALEQLGAPPWSADAIVVAAQQKPVVVRTELGKFEVLIAGGSAEPAIRSADVTARVSTVAAMSPVREFVNALLRSAAAGGGVVMDGRDIGTVVFPDAEVKVYMIAEPEVRARRRLHERGEQADRQSVERTRGSLEERDTRDSTRSVAPLAMAPGAVLIDTTDLPFEAQVGKVVELVRRLPQP